MGNVYLHPTAKGKRPTKAPVFLNIKQQLQVCDHYRAGWHSGEIAKLMNISTSTVRAILHREGVPLRPPSERGTPRVTQKEYEQLRFLYERCLMSIKDIARYQGKPQSTIHSRLLYGGIPIRSRREANIIGARKRAMKKPKAA